MFGLQELYCIKPNAELVPAAPYSVLGFKYFEAPVHNLVFKYRTVGYIDNIFGVGSTP